MAKKLKDIQLNRIDLVDPSVLRLGRLGMHLYIPLPDDGDRAKIFAIEARGIGRGRPAERRLRGAAGGLRRGGSWPRMGTPGRGGDIH